MRNPFRYLRPPITLLTFVAVGVGLVFLSPFLLIARYTGMWSRRSRLRARGRLIRWAEAVRRAERGEGTLLLVRTLDRPWHYWWTREKLTPPAPDMEEQVTAQGVHPWVAWCRESVLDAERGFASLVTRVPAEWRRDPPGRGLAARVLEKFPDTMIIYPCETRPGGASRHGSN